MTLQGLSEEQLAALLASVEQLRIADDLPYASNSSGSTSRGTASGASTVTRTPARPTRSTGSMRPKSVRQPAVSYKESSSDSEEVISRAAVHFICQRMHGAWFLPCSCRTTLTAAC